MNFETILFIIIGFVMLVAAIGMVATRNMVHSALFMALTLLATAALYIVYQAPFIAMVQIIVYAGGIMVLILFVIMLVGAEKMTRGESLRWQIPLVLGLVVTFLLEVIYLATRAPLANSVPVGPEFGGPSAVGLELFSRQTLLFEIASLLLLVAMVGVIVLTPRKWKKQ